MIMALWPTKIENCFLKIVILSHEFSAASFCCNLVYLMFDPPCGFRTPKRRNSVLSVFHTTTSERKPKFAFNLYELIELPRYDIKNWMPLLPDALYTAGTTSVDGTASTEREEKKSALQTLRDVLTEMQHPLEDSWHIKSGEKKPTPNQYLFSSVLKGATDSKLLTWDASQNSNPVEWLKISGPNRSLKSFDFPLFFLNSLVSFLWKLVEFKPELPTSPYLWVIRFQGWQVGNRLFYAGFRFIGARACA